MYEKFQEVERLLNEHLVERDAEIHGITLGILSGTNVLLLGQPGIAKSMIVNYYSSLISGAVVFSTMLNQFSTPEELAGPFSLKGLENDQYIRNTSGRLPEADFGFIDEVYKGNTGVANFLLTMMNERIFYNNGIATKVPLISMVGASNELPEDGDDLEAMLDRFVIKFLTKPIAETSNFLKMLDLQPLEHEPILSLEEIHAAKNDIPKVELDDTSKKLLAALRTLIDGDGLYVSDRTYMTIRNILKAEAFFNGKAAVSESDFDILQHCLWSDPNHRKTIYGHILTKINPDKNKIDTLFEAATDLYAEFLELDQQDPQLSKHALEKANKLKNAKAKIHVYAESLQSKKLSAKEPLKYETKIETFLKEIYTACGIKF